MSPPPLRGAAGGQAAPASNYLGGPVSEAVTDGGEGSTVRCVPCAREIQAPGSPSRPPRLHVRRSQASPGFLQAPGHLTHVQVGSSQQDNLSTEGTV